MTALLLLAVATLAAGSIHSAVAILKELHTMSQSLDNLKAAVTRLEATAAAAIAAKTPDDSAELDAVTARVTAVSDSLAAATPAPTPATTTPGT